MIVDMTRARDTLARASFGAALVCITLLAAGCVKPVERDDAAMAASPEQVRRAPTQPAVRPQAEAVAEKKRKSSVTAKQPVEDPASTKAPVETSLETPALETAAASPTDEPVYVASELMGKKPAEVTALMGAPARVEQRAASTVWIYQDGDCGLDVFFFLDVATSDERVLTVAPTAESEAAAANAASAAASEAPAPNAVETPPSTTAQSSTGGAPTAGAEPDATPPVSPAPAGSVVDVCYGKLRRS